MKKIILVGAIALLGLASCKKDYTCECKLHVIDSEGNIYTGTPIITNLSSITRNKATSDCKGIGKAGEISSDIVSECYLND